MTEKLFRDSVSRRRFCKRSFALLCLAAMSFAILASAQARATQQTQSAKDSSKFPLRFEKNRGQIDEHVKYLARTAGYSIFLANDEADVVLHHEAHPAGAIARGRVIVVRAYANVLRLRFADSNLPTSIVPLRYHLASRDSSAVSYRGLYSGTDIVFHGDQQKIGIDLDLSPGADPSGIVLELNGATGIILDAAGNAVVHAGETSLVLERPSIFENRNGRRQRVSGGFQIEPNNRLRFLVGLPSANQQVTTD